MRPPVVLTALLVAALIAGCGGDDRLSTGEYRTQANRICQDSDRAVDAVEQPTRATAAAIVDYFNRLLRANEQTTKRFEALDPPEQLADAHADALKANRDGMTEVRRVITEIEGGGDPREVLTSTQGRLRRLSAAATDAAKRLGLDECARAQE